MSMVIPKRSERKYKPYPEYKDSGIEWLGEIPAYWDTKKLKHMLFRNDGGVWGDDYDENGTIVLRSTEQTVGGEWHIDEPAIRHINAEEYKKSKLICEDLLITKSSGSELHIGKTTLVTREIEDMNCCFSNFMQRIRLLRNYSAKYIYYVFNCILGREQLVYYSNTTTGLANLSSTIIGNIHIAVPDYSEQQTIAVFLDSETTRINELIAKKQRLIALLQEQRTALITSTVTKGLNPDVPMKDSGVEWLGEIPAHWEITRLKYAFVLQRGFDLASEDFINGSYPVCGSNGIIGYHIEFTTKGPSVTVGRSGSVGEVNYYEGDFWAHNTSLYVREFLKSNPRFVYFLLEVLNLESLSEGTAVGTLNRNYIHRLLIALPPIQEQQAIADYLDQETVRIDSLVDRINRAVEKLQEYRSALITVAVTGKIDVRAHVT